MNRTLIIVMMLAIILFSSSQMLLALPDGAISRIGKGEINEVAFSPDGKMLAIASSIGIYLYDSDDPNDLTEISLLESNAGTPSVAFSPNGLIIAGGSDNTIKLWDTKSKSIIGALSGHLNIVESVSFSPDGSMIASASDDQTIKLWNTDTKSLITTLKGHTNIVKSVAFSPDGSILASGSWDKTIKLWDVKNKNLIATLEGHTDYMEGIAFSPDGSILAGGSWDKTIKLWDVKNKNLIKTLVGHTMKIGPVAFSPDGKMIASGSSDNTVRLWDVESGEEVTELRVIGVKSIAFSPDGLILASGGYDKTVKLWDVKGRRLINTIDGFSYSMNSIAYSPDGSMIANASSDKIVWLWNAKDGSIIQAFEGHTSYVNSVAFSPDGSIIASGSTDKTIKLWSVESKTLITTFSGHTDIVRGIAFSPDGSMIASGSWDKTIKLWDVKNKNLIATLEGHTNKVNTIAFSHDGSMLASGSDASGSNGGTIDRGTVKLWDVKNKSLITTLMHGWHVRSVNFNYADSILASGGDDDTVKLWDVKNKSLIPITKLAHTDSVRSVVFSLDDSVIAIGSWDRVIKLWDVKSKSLITTLNGHSGPVYSVAFNPADCSILASGSYDCTILLWDITPYIRCTSINIIYPNGGEKLKGGSSYNITWNTTVKDIDHIHLQYSSGGNYQDITPNTGNTGNYKWTTPMIDSSTILIKAIAEDGSNKELANYISNGNFIIDSTPPSTNATLSGTLGENDWYISDVTVTLSATDNLSGVNATRYKILKFDQKEGDGSWQKYSIPFTVTESATIYYRSEDNVGNVETEKSQQINIDKIIKYMITATAETGGTIQPSGLVTVDDGMSQTFTITANKGYRILDVKVDGKSVEAVNTYTFTEVKANHTINATFMRIYTITATEGPNGKIVPSGVIQVDEGANLSFTITSDTNYQIDSVLVDGVAKSLPVPPPATFTYDFENITADHTISTTFILIESILKSIAGQNGKIDPSGDVRVKYGTDQTFIITPDLCYLVADVLVDDRSVGAVTKYTFNNVTSDHKIEATFVIDAYVIKAAAGEHGMIESSGDIVVNCGADQKFTITPDSCYHVADVLVDGKSVEAVTAYTFQNVKGNHTISAAFAIDTYKITSTTEGPGSISPSGDVAVNCGTDQEFTMTANENCHVESVLVDGKGLEDLPVSLPLKYTYKFTNVKADHAISVKFAENPPVLMVSPLSLDFGTIITESSFTISNAGGGTLTWQATRQQSWLTVTPASGSTLAGNLSKVTVTVSRVGLDPNIYTNNIFIISNGGNGNVPVNMTMPEPLSYFIISALKVEMIGLPGEFATYLIKLEGKNGFTGTVMLYDSELPTNVKATFDPKKITLSPAEPLTTSQLVLEVPANILAGEYPFTYPFTILAKPDKGETRQLQLTLKIDKVETIPTTITLVLQANEIPFMNKLDLSGQIAMLSDDKSISLKDLTAKLVFTAPSSKSQTFEVKTDSDGSYRLTSQFSPDEIDKWNVKAIFDGNAKLKNCSREIVFNVTKAIPKISFNNDNFGTLGSEITVIGNLEPASKDELISLNIVNPDGKAELIPGITTEASGIFRYVIQLDIAGDWEIIASWIGNNYYESVSQTMKISVIKELGKVILVLGGSSQENDLDWQTSSRLMNCVHDILVKQRGFDEEDIYYLSPDPNAPNIDNVTSLTALEFAIAKWASKLVNPKVPLYIYMLSHNVEDLFLLERNANQDIYLTTALLDSLLDKLPIGTQITIIIEACHSGRFIRTSENQPTALVGMNRTIIASARGDKPARILQNNLYSFSKSFFDYIGMNKTILESFQYAQDFMSRIPLLKDQYPEMDADGDSKVNLPQDYAVVSNVYIPTSFVSKALPPNIIEATSSQILPKGITSLKIYAKILGVNITQVTATIIPPNSDVGQDTINRSSFEFPEFDLAKVPGKDNEFAATYADFTIPGEYTIIIGAENPDGSAIPIQLTITVPNTLKKGDVNGDGKVSSNDAIIILRFVAGILTPTEDQKQPADVNGDGKISSGDAILILRMAAGLMAPSRDKALLKDRSISVNGSCSYINEVTSLSLEIDNVDTVNCGYITISYNSSTLLPVEVISESDVFMESNINKAGIVKIAFASVSSLSSRIIAKLIFKHNESADISNLQIKEFELYDLNGKPLHTQIGDIVNNMNLPDNNMLLQNYPNPFNPETWIPYQLNEGSGVTIRIHSMTGQMVRELKLGYKPAGVYITQDRAVYWDGRNDTGERVSSGIYFYSIQAENCKAIKKMIVIQ